MQLTGQERKELRKVIITTYPNPEDLRMVISEDMDIHFNHIFTDSAYPSQVFQLIITFQAEGKLEEFIDIIVRDRPKSPAFKESQVLIQKIQSEKDSKDIASLVKAQVEEEEMGDYKKSNLLGKQAEEKENKLAQKDHRLQHFNDCMRKIDFNEAKDIFNSVLQKYGKQEAPVLLLMNESEPKKGDLYLQHIINYLQDLNPDFQVYPRTNYKPYSIGHSPDIVLDEQGLLNRIATWFAIKEEDAQEIDKIIAKIVNSICYGTILLFHFNSWNKLANPGQTCLWLVENFWKPLVGEVSSFCKEQEYYNVKIVLVIDSPGDLDKEIFDLPCVCSPNSTPIEQIQQEQVITIPLRNWQEGEIQDWLNKYIPINDREARRRRARRVYGETAGGIPKLAYHSLWREYERK
jgi:hypothetical protein